jgi:hypothetical protein
LRSSTAPLSSSRTGCLPIENPVPLQRMLYRKHLPRLPWPPWPLMVLLWTQRRTGRTESPQNCGRPEVLRLSAASHTSQFLDVHTYVYEDPPRVSAGSRTPQFLDVQSHIHEDPLGLSAGSRHLKDTNQHLRTRRPYIDRGSSVHNHAFTHHAEGSVMHSFTHQPELYKM